MYVDQAKLFSGRAFVFQSSKVDYSSEKSLVEKIFKSLPQPVKVKDVKLLNSSVDFDCYKVFSKNKCYNIKISFSENCPSLVRESDSLRLVKNQVSPTLLHFDKINIGEEITYLISSQEQSYPLNDLGRGFLFENFSSFLFSWKKLLENDPPKYSIRDNISELLFNLNFKESFFEDAYEAASEMDKFDKVSSLINDINQNITTIYDSSVLESTHFCHGNLNHSNILWRNGLFKFCNFNKSFSGHHYLDLSQLILRLGISKTSKRKMIKEYSKYMDLDFNEKEYKLCEKINTLMILGEILVRYFTEIYIFESSRPVKFCEIITLFSQNLQEFSKFDFFSDYKSFLIKMISSPINSL
tara:strand:+ start:455 stop:1519 length:1065 start_codon:yes stop_codon:yes gene_type:complete